ncbi:antigenic cell wall galactomannoprotein [Cordyceps militaris CM01]|uniref:Antigenic cell wall galactomannoprotein n=2 Tax=Cordyceps militaris TaxID=73501 RepID=G3JL57_CORMM|nr:antigenic cell wall galactomannoprotein [Cordyceps militaris CM01]ATY62612.1 antigenic cell wall galactomanno [Cordyceps militaris]EGX90431.1 antigenic cell wall galactomannoprotein [Cordyceps militaris CM01]
MQFKLFALAALATSVVAAADIKSALEAVGAATIQLNKTVTAYQGGLLGLIPITTDALCLLNDINQGTRTAKASAPLNYEAALDIASSVGNLANSVDDVINNFIRTKPKFDKLLIVTPIIKGTLETQRAATADLSKAVLAKTPTELAEIAAILVKQIDDKFAEGIKVYSK